MTRPARQGEGALSDAIREALEAEGVLVLRNAQVATVKANRMVRGGCGNGSADLLCVVPMRAKLPTYPDGFASWEGTVEGVFGRWASLEVKLEIPTLEQVEAAWRKLGPMAMTLWSTLGSSRALAHPAVRKALRLLGKDDRHLLEQEAHLDAVRRHGGFAAYVDSVESAVAAVARCRKGESR